MGTVSYAGSAVEFSDRVLTHVQIVVVQKFRRNEPFMLSWIIGDSAGHGGRTSWWLTPSVPILFNFAGSRVPTVDQEWLVRLAQSADSSRGLIVVDERGVLIPGTVVATDAGMPRVPRTDRR